MGSEPKKPTRAYRQDIAGGQPTALLPDGVIPATISPDGKAILAIDGNRKWAWYPVAGGAAQPAPGLTADDPPVCVIGWSADHRALFVRTGTGVPARVDRVDIKTGQRTLLKELGPSNVTGLATFDPQTVSHDGGQYAYRYRKILSTLFTVSR